MHRREGKRREVEKGEKREKKVERREVFITHKVLSKEKWFALPKVSVGTGVA